MTHHLFGAVLTAEGVASNNRGENAGNVSTLQKVLRGGEIYTTVSAEAIRYAMREYWSSQDEKLNRSIDGDDNTWADTTFKKWKEHLDDDLFGFMDAKKETVKRRGRFEISRALSTRPWTGDTLFNVASVGAHPRDNSNPIPYSTEVHSTRYQFLFALTPARLEVPSRALKALDAVQNLHRVAGNHSRYLYDFAPEAVVLRLTRDPVPRMMYCFEESEFGAITVDKLLHALESGDIDGTEVVTGGRLLSDSDEDLAQRLENSGVSVHRGVKAAFEEISKRLQAALEGEAA